MRISLIIPVYNAEDYVRQTLASAQAAISGVEAEVICVDDGSVDRSAAILDEFAASDPRFRVVHKANGGEGSARNAGLEIAKGEWIAYLDADDLLRPGLFALIEDARCFESSADLVSFGSKGFTGDDSVEWDLPERPMMKNEVSLKEAMPDCLASIGVWQILYRANRYSDLRFTGHSIGADLIYTAKCFSRADALLRVGLTGYAYRYRGDSMCHAPLTPARFVDVVGYHVQMFQELMDCGKRISRSLGRSRCNGLVEYCASELDSHRRDAAWEPLWTRWFESLEIIRKMPMFSLWQGFVMWILTSTRSRSLACILCVLPHRLKRKGFHR